MDQQLKKTLSEREEELKICTSCPSRQVLELLANRWKLLVIHASRMNDVMRNGELRRSLEGISQKMLTETLRSLERDGVVQRIDYQEIPPRVDYRLTELGQDLCVPVMALSDWGIDNMHRIQEAREAFDAANT